MLQVNKLLYTQFGEQPDFLAELLFLTTRDLEAAKYLKMFALLQLYVEYFR